MKIFTRLALCLVSFLTSTGIVRAQCITGYNQATLNWDYLDYLIYVGNYTAGNGFLPALSWAQTQNFAFGTQRLTISSNYGAADMSGENTTHTGEAGSYGTGADVQFIGDGIITLTFENEVRNLKFSIYDIDRTQRVQIGAKNAANVALNVTLTPMVSTILTVTNNNTPNARVDAATTNAGVTATTANVNVDIAGPVKTITITVTNTATNGGENGSFWLSDITACSAGTFPINYYAVSRPFTGQPGYVLIALDKSIYAVNPATGKARFLFSDAAGPGNINSMAYDPYNKILYYVYSLTDDPDLNHILKKYDFNTETISTVLADVNSIGVPTTSHVGVESGAAAFYNGSLYLGIEASNDNSNSGRESVIWRIDFNASNVPYRSCQVFALPVDNSGTLIHDWADFTIKDGVLYDFDGANSNSSNETDIYHYNLLTGDAVNYDLPNFIPGQPSVGWNGTLYQLYASSASSTVAYVAVYNSDGTIGTRNTIISTPMFTPAIPSLGDAAEGFRPKSDFGDAPASYDPDPLAPATHEYLPTLRLGATFDHEWNLTSSALATADGTDEDGIGAAPALNYAGKINYSVTVKVFNNTGAAATLGGWLDYNFNGVFDAGEGVTVNVPANAAMQNITLNWSNIIVPNTSDLRTFLRLRVTSAANGMTTASRNGWFADGEVEDYPVLMGTLLSKEILHFSTALNDNKETDVHWELQPSSEAIGYEIERSADQIHWETIRSVATASNYTDYTITDKQPLPGFSYYRLKIKYSSSTAFSDIKTIYIDRTTTVISLLENPVTTTALLQITASGSEQGSIQVNDNTGRLLLFKHVSINAGNNKIPLPEVVNWSAGIYVVQVQTGTTRKALRLVVSRE